MKKILYLCLFCLLVGCTPQHQRGGDSRIVLPAVEGSGGVEFNQPENPEGVSSSTYRETKTIVHPDGRVETTTREAGTEVGGSQDFAKILKEYMGTEYFRGLIFGLGLILLAWFAYRKEWPLVAGCFALGGLASIFVAWWAGALGTLLAAGLYVGYKFAKP